MDSSGLNGNEKLSIKLATELEFANVVTHTFAKLLDCMWKLACHLKLKCTFS
jgi:hypothetical protein